ncbi:MAG: family 20 glycosylhydrolase [Clostridia bacterium]|nr:family 20 glycosylhydrolase [Clostridia bacterium]
MIFPIPKKFVKTEGSYNFKRSYNDSSLPSFYKDCLLADEIKIVHDKELSKEEYKLTINSDGVLITSSDEEGTFRAVTSLFQLFKRGDGKAPWCSVEDRPDFERRGYMLDISRGRMPKKETIKEVIDLLSLLKYNEFQLYMDNFCFKYPLIPDVTKDIDCLTPEDVKELEEYCKERFVDLVPNQNCFGHMENWLSRDEYKHLEVGYERGEKTSTINPLHPETTELVDKIFDSLLPYFSSGYVNIGLDEAGGLGKYELEEYCNKKGRDVLFMENLNRIADYIYSNHGKRVQFWADMITGYPNSFTMIPEGAVALEWGYEYKDERKMEKHCRDLKEKGVDFYVCPSCNTHYSLTGRFETTTANLRTTAEIGREFGAKGYLVTDWSCGGEGHPHFAIWSYLPAAVGAMYAWNVEEEEKELIMETYFDRRARDFLDFFIFGGTQVSERLQRLANYYLLEPERVRLGTICGMLLWQDVSVRKHCAYFDLDDCGRDYYFDNVARYVKEVIDDVKTLDMDERYKREIIVNSNMVIFSSLFCKLRMNSEIDKNTAKYLVALADEIYEEYKDLWNFRNYEKGMELFLNVISARKSEIEKYV